MWLITISPNILDLGGLGLACFRTWSKRSLSISSPPNELSPALAKVSYLFKQSSQLTESVKRASPHLSSVIFITVTSVVPPPISNTTTVFSPTAEFINVSEVCVCVFTVHKESIGDGCGSGLGHCHHLIKSSASKHILRNGPLFAREMRGNPDHSAGHLLHTRQQGEVRGIKEAVITTPPLGPHSFYRIYGRL